MSPADLNTLALKARGGDTAAAEALLKELRPQIVKASRTPVPGMEPADLQQEAAIALLTKIDGWDPAKGDFAPYAQVVISNVVGMQLRHALRDKRRHTIYALPLDGSGQGRHGAHCEMASFEGEDIADRRTDAAVDPEYHELVAAKLAAEEVYARGTAVEVQVAELRADGLTRKEISAEVGISDWEVRQSLTRLRRKISPAVVAGHGV